MSGDPEKLIAGPSHFMNKGFKLFSRNLDVKEETGQLILGLYSDSLASNQGEVNLKEWRGPSTVRNWNIDF